MHVHLKALFTRMFMGPNLKNLWIIFFLVIFAIFTADAKEDVIEPTSAELIDQNDFEDITYDTTDYRDSDSMDRKITSIQRSPAIVNDDYPQNSNYEDQSQELTEDQNYYPYTDNSNELSDYSDDDLTMHEADQTEY